MLRTYQRYLAAHFIPPFIFSTLFFVAFLLTFQLFRVMQVVIGKSVETSVIFELVGHIALSFFPMAIPISTLFAAIYTMNRFSEDSEIVAMRSFGASKHKLFSPFLMVSLLVALILFSLNISLIPNSRAQFRNTLIVLSSQGMLSDVRPEQFYMDIPGVTLFAENVSEGGDHFEDVFIVLDSQRDNQEQVITAKSGTLIKHFGQALPIDSWSMPTLRMHLLDGSITKTNLDNEDMEVIHFEEYDFPVMTEHFQPSTIARDSMRTNRELSELINYRRDRVKNLEKRKDDAGISSSERQELDNLRNDISSALMEYWSRFNVPVQCIVFALLGFSLGIKQGRGKSKNSGGLSVAIVIAYYAIFFGGMSLTQRGLLHPVASTFSPTLITLAVAIYLYHKIDWLS